MNIQNYMYYVFWKIYTFGESKITNTHYQTQSLITIDFFLKYYHLTKNFLSKLFPMIKFLKNIFLNHFFSLDNILDKTPWDFFYLQGSKLHRQQTYAHSLMLYRVGLGQNPKSLGMNVHHRSCDHHRKVRQ